MSGISGKKREESASVESVKKVGLFLGNVIAVNPSVKEYKDILGIELKEDSKATEYSGEKDGNTTLRVDFWIENSKANEDGSKDKFKVNFFLTDKVRENKDGTKTQFINEVGMCTWAESESGLPDWFKKRDFREAKVGEEELYEFLRNWLKMDYMSNDTTLSLDWKRLIKGNVKDLAEQIGGDLAGEVGCLATIITKENDGKTTTYQGVYNKAFLPTYAFKHIRNVDYDNPIVLEALSTKPSKELKPHERFVLKVKGSYGCSDFHLLKDLKDYDPNENLVESNNPLIEDNGSDY